MGIWAGRPIGKVISIRPLIRKQINHGPPCRIVFHDLCQRAATAAGYPDFQPDACLINRYAPGAKLSLHQDKDEPDLRAPIVSVSLGLPAIFQFGGLKRNDPHKRLLLEHGDVVVWGGESRLFYHGIQPLKAGFHPLTADCRYNLTFRQAGKKNKNKNYYCCARGDV